MTAYQKFIAATAKHMNIEVDPRHVEGWMRLDYHTLCHLDASVFRRYIRSTAKMEATDPGAGEQVARSYGL